jgi:hypothetical protein
MSLVRPAVGGYPDGECISLKGVTVVGMKDSKAL